MPELSEKNKFFLMEVI